jgi:hypothetical protein
VLLLLDMIHHVSHYDPTGKGTAASQFTRQHTLGLSLWGYVRDCAYISPLANINDSKNRTGLLLYELMQECCNVYGEREHAISIFHAQQMVPILNVVKVYNFPPLQMVKKQHMYLVSINLYFRSNL